MRGNSLGVDAVDIITRVLRAEFPELDAEQDEAVSRFGGMNVSPRGYGPLLDVAFVRTKLNRNQVVATKAATQVFSHILKLVYFATFLTGSELTVTLLLAILVATLAGTWAGTRILARMSERSFFTWSRYIVYAIGVMYLYKAFDAWP